MDESGLVATTGRATHRFKIRFQSIPIPVTRKQPRQRRISLVHNPPSPRSRGIASALEWERSELSQAVDVRHRRLNDASGSAPLIVGSPDPGERRIDLHARKPIGQPRSDADGVAGTRVYSRQATDDLAARGARRQKRKR